MPLMPVIADRIMFKHIKLFFKDLYNLLLLFSFISYQRSVSESLVLRFPQSEPHRHFFKNTDFLLPVSQFLTLHLKNWKAVTDIRDLVWPSQLGTVFSCWTWAISQNTNIRQGSTVAVTTNLQSSISTDKNRNIVQTNVQKMSKYPLSRMVWLTAASLLVTVIALLGSFHLLGKNY